MQAPGKQQFNAGIPMQQARGDDPVGRAIGSLGQSIKGVGNLSLDLYKQQQRQYLTDAEIIMRRTSSELAGKLALNKSPAEHQEIANKHFNKVKRDILGTKGIDPATYDLLSERINLFTSAKLEKIGVDAKLMMVENGKMLKRTLIDMEVADSNFSGAGSLYDEGVNEGLWPKEYAEANKMRLGRMERNEGWKEQARIGNDKFFRGDDFQGSEGDRRKFIAESEANKARMERDDLQKISKAMEAGDIVTKDQLEERLKSAKNVSEESKKIILRNWDKTQPISDEERQEIIDEMISLREAYRNREMNLDEYQARHAIADSKISLFGRRTGVADLRKEVAPLDPSGWSVEAGNIPHLESKKIDIETIGKTIWETGGFSNPGELPEDATRQMKLDHAKALKDSKANRAKAQKKVYKWLSRPENKDAGWDEIQQYMSELSAKGALNDLIDDEPEDLDAEFRALMVPSTMLPQDR